MKHRLLVITIIILFIFVGVGWTSLFIVNQGDSAFILRLGRIVSDENGQPMVKEPGLHWKWPVVDRVHYFDMRLQEFSTSPLHPLVVVTQEQTYLVVEYFVKWRINQLAKFYTSTGGGNVQWAETLLEQRINDIVRANFGKHTSNQAISTDRRAMISAIKEEANTIGQDQGIQVVDVRIQQMSLPKDVMDSVFKRMATERKQFAAAKRAEGVEKSEEIRAKADQEATVIKAQAKMQGAQLRAMGDQEAAKIYSKAFTVDPAFYSFYRSLEAYRKSFHSKRDVLILQPEGQFFHYFHSANPSAESKKKMQNETS